MKYLFFLSSELTKEKNGENLLQNGALLFVFK